MRVIQLLYSTNGTSKNAIVIATASIRRIPAIISDRNQFLFFLLAPEHFKLSTSLPICTRRTHQRMANNHPFGPVYVRYSDMNVFYVYPLVRLTWIHAFYVCLLVRRYMSVRWFVDMSIHHLLQSRFMLCMRALVSLIKTDKWELKHKSKIKPFVFLFFLSSSIFSHFFSFWFASIMEMLKVGCLTADFLFLEERKKKKLKKVRNIDRVNANHHALSVITCIDVIGCRLIYGAPTQHLPPTYSFSPPLRWH